MERSERREDSEQFLNVPLHGVRRDQLDADTQTHSHALMRPDVYIAPFRDLSSVHRSFRMSDMSAEVLYKSGAAKLPIRPRDFSSAVVRRC